MNEILTISDIKKKILMCVNKILKSISQKIHKLQFQLNKNNKGSGKYEFLTPNDNAKGIDEYSKALSEALEKGKVKNIAISGSYGSGKSSFIQTFERANSQYNFLDISLAKFKKDSENKSNLSLIEKSILEQIFYKVKNKTLPQSRLNKINRLRWTGLKIVFIMLVILSYFVVFSPDIFKEIDFVKDNLKSFSVEAMIILSIGLYFSIKKLLIIASNTNIKKLNLQNLELASNDDGSLLNKHLDEILYFFEKTHFDIVVFQDLDRFENLEIFTKLRELNNFINNSEQVGKKIVFIYAVKDEMFKDANERTKFFDFLIPIIPYINSTNSYEQLLSYFNQDVDRNFLSDISFYISDMRLLKNIHTEYQIYSATLNYENVDIKLNHTKLLSMIVYKNFEPQDFELLHKSKGLVYDIFAKKSEYVASHISGIRGKVDEIQEKIEEINDEPRGNIKELRRLYILKIIENMNNKFNGIFYLNNKNLNITDAVEDENFELIKESENITSRNQNGYHSISIDFRDIEKELGDYHEREKNILDKSNNAKEALLKKVQDLRNNQKDLGNLELSEIIEKFGGSQVFSDENIKDKKLLKYLISYGHLDKNYEDYISNFFGVSITRAEQVFLVNIKNSGKHLPFDFELKNLEHIASNKLSDNEFKKESVLNYDLVAYICKNKEKYRAKYNMLFQQLLSDSELSKEFIFDCIKTKRNGKDFLESILIEWKGFWGYMAVWGSFDPTSRENIFYQILSICDKNIIIDSNHGDKLKDVMAMLANWHTLNSDKDILSKFKEIIAELDVKFMLVNPAAIDNELLNYLYVNNYYKLDRYAINYLIRVKCQEVDEDFLAKAHLSAIKKLGLDELLKYINVDINTYIQYAFLEIETNTQESEKIITELLNNKNLEENLKEKIIKQQETKINDINLINKELWNVLISNNKLQASWINASLYYDYSDGLSDELIEYLDIKENALELSKTRVGVKYCERNKEFKRKFLKGIILTNSFALESYESLIKNIGYWYDDLDISSLDEEKILLLIRHNIIQFKKVCFDALKEYTDTLHISLIEKFADELLEKFAEFEFDASDIIDIIRSENIKNPIKQALIEKSNIETIINENTADLVYKYVDKAIVKPLSYSIKMLQNLQSLELKINLVVGQKDSFNEDSELVEILKLLPVEYQKIANLNGKQTVLDNNKSNLALSEILKNRNFITKYKFEKSNKKIRLYIKNR
jgi:hypothetical protein